MSSQCEQTERMTEYALRALPLKEVAAIEVHLSSCLDCQRELRTLRPIVDSFAFWPKDVLPVRTSLQQRLAQRIAAETGGEPVSPPARQWQEPAWENVAPGISCKILATDSERDRVSMLVRLAPGGEYPPHTHAATEELHLLEGELWIDDRKLFPGDYSRAERGSADARVWSETGCTCVLITSTNDVLD
jgi:hypothetical protein